MGESTRLHTNSRMSQAVIHGDTVYLAGQVAADNSADVAGQTKQILQQIDGLLAEAGSDKAKILMATIWLSDIDTFDEMNGEWDAWVPEGRHARTGLRRVEARQRGVQGRDPGRRRAVGSDMAATEQALRVNRQHMPFELDGGVAPRAAIGPDRARHRQHDRARVPADRPAGRRAPPCSTRAS